MDRRQRKTREAIFTALIELLSQKDFSQITVGQIIETADVGRATFYAHFETKEHLLQALCKELFCHIFDAAGEEETGHQHIFTCQAPASEFVHLFQHLKNNDNNILKLLSCRNNELFLRYFESELKVLITKQLPLFSKRKNEKLPESFWIHHIASTFTQTLRWWVDNGMHESAETITEYFFMAV